MQDKIKNKVVTAVFVIFIAFFVVMCAFMRANPVAQSEAERRPLAQFPAELSWQGVIDGMDLNEGESYSFGEKMFRFNKSLGNTFKLVLNKTLINDFEKYSVDQFPFREFFRGVKARFQMNVINLKENNGLAVEDGYIAKIESNFSDIMMDHSFGVLEKVYNNYIKDKADNVYISLIPDKNYFFDKNYGYVSPDYQEMIDRFQSAMPEAEYIDIFGALTLEDYYRTDTHWSQDKLGNVVSVLSNAMGFADRLSGKYESHTHYPFYGVYHGQSALNPKPDTITYLTNSTLDKMIVFDYMGNVRFRIYNSKELTGQDGYNFFLSGSKPLLRIDNPDATTDKELVLFRDSYGSSIAPLIAEGYKRVYVVDLRYAKHEIVNSTIDFEGKDVLFLYSSLVLNTNTFLK